MPFSDPMADGPVIQRATERALAQRRRACATCSASSRDFRANDTTTPVVLMGYANPIEAMGVETLRRRARRPPASTACWSSTIRPRNAATFADAAAKRRHRRRSSCSRRPRTDARIARGRASSRSGYVYYVSLKGVTGAGHLDTAEVARKLPQIRAHVQAAGRRRLRHPRRGDARARSPQIADAVVIGSRIVQEIETRPPDAAPTARARGSRRPQGAAIRCRAPRGAMEERR